ncbi:transglycosylase domain-containing protein [Streptomyces sp. NPDC002896]|uniref:transglycosylase domain-containing protein n=1 Tax=Streptomyces sp. NPDC002896 TaxID=3154438 RepID=UPI003317A05F
MSDEPQQSKGGWAPRDAGPKAPGAPATGPTPGTGAALVLGGASGRLGPAAAGTPGKLQEGAPKPGGPRQPKRTGWRRAVPTWRTVIGSCLGLALLCIGAFAAGYLLVQIPPANAAAVAQSNVYLYSDGSPLARDGDVNRENVALASIPKTVQHAVLAAEDRDFYSEPAVDPAAMIRGAWNTLIGKGKQSGSTITQQYVKNYYLGQEQTVTRKVKEFFISIKLAREASKDRILEGYLNTSYFGRNAYGIQAAAQAYYGVDVEHLDTGQGAYLATLLNAPSAYDVVAHPQNMNRAIARWNYVLDGMVKENWLTPAERTTMHFPVPHEAKPAAAMSGQRGYIVQAVNDYLISHKILDEDALESVGGYRITTTIEKKEQQAFVDAVDDQVMSQVSKDSRPVDGNVRVGGASVDPDTGKVIAMYGGIDYTQQYVNNATRRDYQVGSTFKPFVFTAAVENGSRTQDGRPITPNTIYDGDSKRRVEGWHGTPYAPENEDKTDYGPISVRDATDNSVNAVYAQMAADVGPDRVKSTAVHLGVPQDTPDLSASPSIALGTATASVLDMAQAYATLANHGRYGAATLVEKVTRQGESVGLPKQHTQQAVSRESADTTTYMLQSVVEDGTGAAAQAAGRPAAGKTGTAENDTAAWFAGYTPDLATVVVVMGQNPVTGEHTPLYGALGESRINGGDYPARIWAQYTEAALAGRDVQDFDLQLAEGADEPDPFEDWAEEEWYRRHRGLPGSQPSKKPGAKPSKKPGAKQSGKPGDKQGDKQGRTQESPGQTGGRTQGPAQGAPQPGPTQGAGEERPPGLTGGDRPQSPRQPQGGTGDIRPQAPPAGGTTVVPQGQATPGRG